MELFLIRHGPTHYNQQRRWQGRVDIPLNREGKALANAIGGELRSQNVSRDNIYSSPLSRAVETARIIAAEPFSVSVDDRLIEIDLGQYDGRNENEIKREVGTQEYELWRRENFRIPAPGGESFDQLKKRVGDFFEDLSATQVAPQILVVAHQMSLMALKSVISGDSRRATLSRYKQRNDVVEVWNTVGKCCVSTWEVTQDLAN